MTRRITPELPPSAPRRPIDLWLALASAAVGIVFWALPRTHVTVSVAAILIVGLLAHPLWNFWWVSERLYRRMLSTLLLLVTAGTLWWLSWTSLTTVEPPESQRSTLPPLLILNEKLSLGPGASRYGKGSRSLYMNIYYENTTDYTYDVFHFEEARLTPFPRSNQTMVWTIASMRVSVDQAMAYMEAHPQYYGGELGPHASGFMSTDSQLGHFLYLSASQLRELESAKSLYYVVGSFAAIRGTQIYTVPFCFVAIGYASGPVIHYCPAGAN